MNGIDVSHWQGEIDWEAVKTSGIQFAILKAGGSDDGFYKDHFFERNYAGAKAVHMPVGAYYFVGKKCISYKDGVADAKRFLDMLKGKTFEYPVYIDLEATSIADKAGATWACIGFVETMEAAGYYCGIYASDISGFKDKLNISELENIDKWVARYGSEPSYVTGYGMWQQTDKGSVNGILGYADLDRAYKDYPNLIKAAGLNGFKGAEQSQEQPENNLEAEYARLQEKLERIQSILDE